MGKKSSKKYDRLILLDESSRFLSGTIGRDDFVITNELEFTALLDSEFEVNQVFILVEVDWNNPLTEFRGYKVAIDLFNNVNRSSRFSLVFLSTIDRTVLREAVPGRFLNFVKSFNHYKIESGFALNELELPETSELKFNFNRNYCLTSSGILDILEHDLRSGRLLSEDEKNRLLKTLMASSDLLGVELASMVRTMTVESFDDMRQSIHDKIVKVKRENSLQNESVSDAPPNLRWKPAVIVVEDDITQLQAISNALTDNFEVAAFQNGAEALQKLKDSPNDFNIVLCDMDLLDKNRFDQSVQGIDIVEFVSINLPSIVIKVVSNLPRRGLIMLFGERFGLSDFLLKPLLVENNQSYLSDLFVELRKSVEAKRVFKRLRGPSNALWGSNTPRGSKQDPGYLKLFYYKLKHQDSKRPEFQQLWKDVDGDIEQILKGNKKVPGGFGKIEKLKQITKLPPKEFYGYLQRLLVNRLFGLENYTTDMIR